MNATPKRYNYEGSIIERGLAGWYVIPFWDYESEGEAFGPYKYQYEAQRVALRFAYGDEGARDATP